MTSTRLPGKVLLTAGGRSMLAHHVERLRSSEHHVIIATTTNEEDDPIVNLAGQLGIDVFRGSEDDVLSRFAGAARAFDLDVVVRVTSDCPLIDGALVSAGIEQFLQAEEPALYLSNTLERSFPRGFDFEIMSADRLFAAEVEASSPYQREHVTPWLYESSQNIIRQLMRKSDASGLRVTLDTHDDLELIRTLIEQHGADQLNGEEIIAILLADPILAGLNAHVEQKKLTD